MTTIGGRRGRADGAAIAITIAARDGVQVAPVCCRSRSFSPTLPAAIRATILTSTGPIQQGGRWVYRIKWLTPDGRVIIIFADAETGQILGHARRR